MFGLRRIVPMCALSSTFAYVVNIREWKLWNMIDVIDDMAVDPIRHLDLMDAITISIDFNVVNSMWNYILISTLNIIMDF